MTEPINSPHPPMADVAHQHPSLRQAREAAGLQAAALAAMLKVPVERLLALEEGRYHDLPNLTFARALASSVCRTLKMDPAPVLQELPQVSAVKLGHDISRQAVVDLPRRRKLFALPRLRLRSPLTWALLLLLLALLLWWWLPQRELATSLLAPAEQQVRPQALVAEPVIEKAAVAPVAAEPASSAASAQPAAQAAPAALPVAVPQVSEPPAARPLQAAAAPLLQLRARETTWVQLKDIAGKELQQRTLQPGQTLDHDGQGPVLVVLGRSSGVDVIVRGQPFDTSSFASNRVARFEVK